MGKEKRGEEVQFNPADYAHLDPAGPVALKAQPG
jgi:hypothetical protein